MVKIFGIILDPAHITYAHAVGIVGLSLFCKYIKVNPILGKN